MENVKKLLAIEVLANRRNPEVFNEIVEAVMAGQGILKETKELRKTVDFTIKCIIYFLKEEVKKDLSKS